jgi:hypothetical protein
MKNTNGCGSGLERSGLLHNPPADERWFCAARSGSRSRSGSKDEGRDFGHFGADARGC